MSDRTTQPVHIPMSLLERVDEWRESQVAVPSRTAVVRAALTAWLDEVEDRS